jgi:hypothetical protein
MEGFGGIVWEYLLLIVICIYLGVCGIIALREEYKDGRRR